MKREKEKRNTDSSYGRHIYRKQSLDGMPEEGYERAGFDFDEEDIRRYRRQNLQDDPADYADHIDEYIYEKAYSLIQKYFKYDYF